MPVREMKMSDVKLDLKDILAFDRSQLAAERTLMGWVRTALSLISFGFTLYKFLQIMQEQSKLAVRAEAPRNVGIALISMGTLALFVACLQHWQYINKLNRMAPGQLVYKRWGLSFIVACTLIFLGLLMSGNILLHYGPFS